MQVTHDCLWASKHLNGTLQAGFTAQRTVRRDVASWTTRVVGAWWVREGVSTFFFCFFALHIECL